MSRFLAKLFNRKKVNRLERTMEALQAMGEGRLRDAMALLAQADPVEYTKDPGLGLYYFAKGRVAMEMMELQRGENYLTTAWVLGFRRATLFISLAVAKGRLRRLGEARELLKVAREFQLEGEDEVEVIDRMEELLDQVASGKMAKEINSIVRRLCKQGCGKSNPRELKERDWRKLLEKYIRDETRTSPRDEDIALFGAYMVAKHQGVWEYGLEMADHAVLVRGVAYQPARLLQAYYANKLEFEKLGVLIPQMNISSLYLQEEGLE